MERAKTGRKKKGTNKTNSLYDGSPLDKIRQQERVEIIAQELLTMKSKVKIKSEYAEKWKCNKSTIEVIINEAMMYIASADKTDREQMRALNANRLDCLFDEAKGVRDKTKVIDTLNKMYGLYETNVKIDTDENITIDIGV
jgi:hypothetical protein